MTIADNADGSHDHHHVDHHHVDHDDGRPPEPTPGSLPGAAVAPPDAFDPDPLRASEPGASSAVGPLALLSDVKMEVTVELGRTTLPIRELLALQPGMVVEIDRVAGSPIDVLVNGRLIARGEVVVVDEEFGVRITEILAVRDVA